MYEPNQATPTFTLDTPFPKPVDTMMSSSFVIYNSKENRKKTRIKTLVTATRQLQLLVRLHLLNLIPTHLQG